MDAESIFQKTIKNLGYSNVLEIESEKLVDLALKFAIWPSITTYQDAPWLAPYAVRKIRNRMEVNGPGPKRDLWGLPNDQGYFTDDNSLLKSIVLNRPLSPKSSPYGGAKIKSGLVCCHIWSGTTSSPLLFSFVPNLVWLPKSIAKYSDAHHAGTPHPVHFALKQASRERYSKPHPNRRVDKAWSLLDVPNLVQNSAYICTEIDDDEKVINLVTKRIYKMISFLEDTLNPDLNPPNRFSKRYHAGVGSGIDNSVWTVQEWLSRDRRTDLVREMRACL